MTVLLWLGIVLGALVVIAIALRAEDGSATILIRRSKTDAAGEGSAAWLAPTTLTLVDDWLGYTGLRNGLLFRRVVAGSRIGDRLSPGAIAPIVKRAGRWKDTRMPLRYGERVLASRGAMARAAKAQGR